MKDYFAGPQNGLRDIFWIEAAVVHRLRPQGKSHESKRTSLRELPAVV
jgi:hypothetical protein